MNKKKLIYLAVGALAVGGTYYYYFKKPTVKYVGYKSEDDLIKIGGKLIRTDGSDGYTVKVRGFIIDFSDKYTEEGLPYWQRLFSLMRGNKEIAMGVLPTEKGQVLKWEKPSNG